MSGLFEHFSGPCNTIFTRKPSCSVTEPPKATINASM